MPQIQYSILETSSKYLKSGGNIIYSTCTLNSYSRINKKENEKVVAKFLESNNNFEILEEKTVFPTPFGGDGFYYALMRKNND